MRVDRAADAAAPLLRSAFRTLHSATCLDEHRVAEFVRPISVRAHLLLRTTERGVVREGAQQLIVARRRLVDAGEYRIDDAQTGRRTDALSRHARARTDAAVAGGRMFERANHRGADGDDTSA